jgi:hypothetical protein
MAPQQPAPQKPAPAPAAAKEAATKEAAAKGAAATKEAAAPNNDLGLPEERFWIRYSPHHELPLSSVSSFGIHILIVGLLLLCAILPIFSRPVHQVPVEAVTLLNSGGGGGRKSGVDGGSGPPSRPQEIGGQVDPNPEQNPQTEVKRPDLAEVKAPDFNTQLKEDASRFLKKPGSVPNLGKISLLDEAARKVGPASDPSRGRGGSGSGGGQGDGRGTGTGEGSGPGTSSGHLTQRQKRMLRWVMSFKTNNGPDYLAQLRGLGGILAIPVKEGDPPEFKIVRKLVPPAQLLDEDVEKIDRIFWWEENPAAVRDIMDALGLNIRPSRFAMLMPSELEKKLFEMESKHARGRVEDDIAETKFRCVRSGDHYEPVFDSIKFK